MSVLSVPASGPGPDLLAAKEVARWLRVSRRTVWRWLAAGKLPQPIRFSRWNVRWRADDIRRFIDGQQAAAAPLQAGGAKG